MIGGMDRYFQIARCFRDEDQRTNRQPEFTQLDLEMSFVNEQDVMDEVEKLVLSALWDLNCDVKSPFLKISYEEAMNLYGSDAPDLTFELPIQDLTNILRIQNLRFLEKLLIKEVSFELLYYLQNTKLQDQTLSGFDLK